MTAATSLSFSHISCHLSLVHWSRLLCKVFSFISIPTYSPSGFKVAPLSTSPGSIARNGGMRSGAEAREGVCSFTKIDDDVSCDEFKIKGRCFGQDAGSQCGYGSITSNYSDCINSLYTACFSFSVFSEKNVTIHGDAVSEERLTHAFIHGSSCFGA